MKVFLAAWLTISLVLLFVKPTKPWWINVSASVVAAIGYTVLGAAVYVLWAWALA